MNEKTVARVLLKASELLKADSDYIYDPDHKNRPHGGGNWHKTEKGWSTKEERTPKMEFEVDKYIKKSESKNPKIRQSVASDPNTPKHLLKRLMKDEDGEVRRSILDNSSATFEMISALTRDDDEYVSDYAKTEFSNRLKKKYPEELHELIEDATSDDEDIRLDAASDPDLPIELVEHLTNDNDWYVSDSALKNLKNRKDK